MTLIPDLTARLGTAVSRCAELDKARATTVCFGEAPDGLPWLLRVDRSQALDRLYHAVTSSFGLTHLDELPAGVRAALTKDVAAGLMGIHHVSLDEGPAEVFVSRRDVRSLVGSSLLAAFLEPVRVPPAPFRADSVDLVAISTACGFDDEKVAQVEQAIIRSRAQRHLMLRLSDGRPFIGTVNEDDRALRVPRAPFRPAIFESLHGLDGARATITGASARLGALTVPLADRQAFTAALAAVGRTPQGGILSYQVPRASLLQILIETGRALAEVHDQGHIHGDLTPSNILIEGGQPRPFDAENVRVGDVSAAATFEWAAPEQVVGRPVSPATDTFALARMITTLLGGVPFGEETSYVVPTGGQGFRKIPILKTDGVFIDILKTGRDRAWQRAWQGVLARGLAHEQHRRPPSIAAYADELAELAERYPVDGFMPLNGGFGELVVLENGDSRSFAYQISD